MNVKVASNEIIRIYEHLLSPLSLLLSRFGGRQKEGGRQRGESDPYAYRRTRLTSVKAMKGESP